jgi:hypothetical protein
MSQWGSHLDNILAANYSPMIMQCYVSLISRRLIIEELESC